jgi:hypothetical protein
MPRADDVETFEIAVSHWAVIVGADIANGEELTCNIEDDDGTVAHVHEEALPVGEFGCGGDFHEIQVFGGMRSVVEHGDGKQVYT